MANLTKEDVAKLGATRTARGGLLIEVGKANRFKDGSLKVLHHVSGNPVAQGRLARRLMEAHKDQAKVAKLLGVKQPWVSKLLRLMTLPESILDKVEKGRMSAATAYLLTRLPAEERAKLAERAGLVQTDVRKALKRRSLFANEEHTCICRTCGKRL